MSFPNALRRRGRGIAVAAAGLAALSLVAACSSSKSGGGGSSPGSGKPDTGKGAIKVGILGSFTGNAASGFVGLQPGAKARIQAANDSGGVNGRQIDYVVGDDASTPQGAQAAVTKLVQQDKVNAIVDVSSVFYGGYKAAVKAGVPVFGVGWDGCACWLDKSNTNLFDISGVGDYHLVPTTYGLLAKKLGVTRLGGLGYTTSESATLSVKAWIASGKAAGLQAGFSQGVAFGSTDVGPVILGIKNSGTDGFYMSTIPNTAFAVAGGLAQQSLKLKGTFLATGYGGDLLANAAAVQAAQGLQFLTSSAPVELKTPATLKMQQILNKYANQPLDQPPSFSMTQAYLATDALIWALTNAKDDVSSSNIIKTSRDGTWDAAGGIMKPVDFSKYDGLAGGGAGPGNCIYVVTLTGKTFKPIDGLSPICGTIIDGEKVST
jgi:branched-chain amino acid transport system substrate-binding protein